MDDGDRTHRIHKIRSKKRHRPFAATYDLSVEPSVLRLSSHDATHNSYWHRKMRRYRNPKGITIRYANDRNIVKIDACRFSGHAVYWKYSFIHFKRIIHAKLAVVSSHRTAVRARAPNAMHTQTESSKPNATQLWNGLILYCVHFSFHVFSCCVCLNNGKKEEEKIYEKKTTRKTDGGRIPSHVSDWHNRNFTYLRWQHLWLWSVWIVAPWHACRLDTLRTQLLDIYDIYL